jgi:nucleotide-binding universal stress UspA family protein
MAPHRVGRTFASIPHEEVSEMSAQPDLHPCVVVGFDGSPASHVALSRAIDRVGPHGKLYLVHAWEVAEAWRGRGTYQPYVDRALTAAEAVMEAAVEAHPGLKGIAWERELIGGPPAKAIADVADIRRADEIILGTRGFGRVRALLGSVAHELIHLAPCPVTVIPERLVEPDADARVSEAAGVPA